MSTIKAQWTPVFREEKNNQFGPIDTLYFSSRAKQAIRTGILVLHARDRARADAGRRVITGDVIPTEFVGTPTRRLIFGDGVKIHVIAQQRVQLLEPPKNMRGRCLKAPHPADAHQGNQTCRTPMAEPGRAVFLARQNCSTVSSRSKDTMAFTQTNLGELVGAKMENGFGGRFKSTAEVARSKFTVLPIRP